MHHRGSAGFGSVWSGGRILTTGFVQRGPAGTIDHARYNDEPKSGVMGRPVGYAAWTFSSTKRRTSLAISRARRESSAS